MNTDKTMTRREEATPERIQQRQTVTPLVDIYEDDSEILLVADLPGVNVDNLYINLDGGELTIEGCRTKEKKGTMLAEGYDACDYIRTFRVPDSIDYAKIDAQLNNGVLTVHLPKQEAVRPRRITVKAG